MCLFNSPSMRNKDQWYLEIYFVAWVMFFNLQSGPQLKITTVYPGMGVSILKIKRSWDRLIFIMGIPIPVRQHVNHETGHWICTASIYVIYTMTCKQWHILTRCKIPYGARRGKHCCRNEYICNVPPCPRPQVHYMFVFLSPVATSDAVSSGPYSNSHCCFDNWTVYMMLCKLEWWSNKNGYHAGIP